MVLKAICPTSPLVPWDAKLLSGWEELQKDRTTSIGVAQLGFTLCFIVIYVEKLVYFKLGGS